MNEDDLIHGVAHQLDPQVFDHQGSQPPDNFFGSPEWWEVSKNSRRQRATKDAAAALRAVRALGFTVVPRIATDAMVRAGAARLGTNNGADAAMERTAREVWDTMLAAAETEPPA
jgi:hypothetical protein